MDLKGLNPFRKGRPSWVDRITADSRRIDVRRLIASGAEPLGAVMELAGSIAPGETFVIEAPFDPQPLRRVLETQGFESYGEEIEAGHWRIWLRRVSAAGKGAVSGEAATARIVQDDSGWHVDGRGVPPPGPMIAVIALLDTPAITGPIFVHLDRDPIHLYSELTERNWRWTGLDAEPGEVRLRLDKDKT